MKRVILLLAVLALLVRADDLTPVPAAATGDDASAAHDGFPPTRYEQLWSKSPFAVETPDETATDSADYALVGVAQLGDVTYASLVDKHTNDHLLISSDKPLGGLSITSLSKRPDGIYVSLTRNGEPMTLKLENAPASAGTGAAGGFSGNPTTMPNTMAPFTMPGSMNPQIVPPRIRIRRPLIHLPPRFPNQSIPGATGQPVPPPGA